MDESFRSRFSPAADRLLPPLKRLCCLVFGPFNDLQRQRDDVQPPCSAQVSAGSVLEASVKLIGPLAVSGTSPLHPVVSTKSGLVYEKDLILKYLKDNDGKDPITGEELAETELIEVKTGKQSLHSAPKRR